MWGKVGEGGWEHLKTLCKCLEILSKTRSQRGWDRVGNVGNVGNVDDTNYAAKSAPGEQNGHDRARAAQAPGFSHGVVHQYYALWGYGLRVPVRVVAERLRCDRRTVYRLRERGCSALCLQQAELVIPARRRLGYALPAPPARHAV